MTGAKEGLLRRHSEEIYNRKNLAVCDETHAPLRNCGGDGDMQREVLLGVWPKMCGLESRREEHRCRR